MSLPTTTVFRSDTTANGSATDFVGAWKILAATDIVVLKTDLDGVVTIESAYTVLGVGADSGFTVRFTTAPTANHIISILPLRNVGQPSTWNLNANFGSVAVEAALDQIVQVMLRCFEELDRATKFPQKSALKDIDFPLPVADGQIKWNAAATALEAVVNAVGALTGTVTISDSVVPAGTKDETVAIPEQASATAYAAIVIPDWVTYASVHTYTTTSYKVKYSDEAPVGDGNKRTIFIN